MTLQRLSEPTETRSGRSLSHFEGVWNEYISQEGTSAHDFRAIPAGLVRRYAKCAVRLAIVRQLDDGTWFAEVPNFDGVWASGEAAADVIPELEDVIFDWAILKMLDGDTDIPPVGDIDLRTT